MSANFPIQPFREQEALRRAACLNPSDEELEMLRDCARDAGYLIDYKIKERNRPLELLEKQEPRPGFVPADYRELFQGCDAIIIFTASLGQDIRDQVEEDEPEKRLFYQAVCAERLDALCQAYFLAKERQLAPSGGFITADYPYFWENVPEDSYNTTRVMGVALRPDSTAVRRCSSCMVQDCPSRK